MQEVKEMAKGSGSGRSGIGGGLNSAYANSLRRKVRAASRREYYIEKGRTSLTNKEFNDARRLGILTDTGVWSGR